MKYIDMRSDTVTTPTDEMREAMAKAVVGDDVYGDDPTVNQLQELAADMVGMEAGLFVPSGTMGNLISLLAHCDRGDEILVGKKSHIFLYEGGGASSFGGIHSRQIAENADGSLPLDVAQDAVRVDDEHEPITRLIAVESTHNALGGVCQTPQTLVDMNQFAKRNGLAFHMDGARLFNSAVAQNIPVSELTKHVDSVTFCLSKGLAAPVGSVICGSHAFMKKARRARKHLGGGMRQAGIIAAAGIISLEKMVNRLADDHTRAKKLATGLKDLPGIKMNPEVPPTNMAFFDILDSNPITIYQIEAELKKRGVLAGAMGSRRFRFVTHYQITDADVEQTIAAMKEILR
jgi:threonine aldolase